MSSRCRKNPGDLPSRRSCLRWAAASLAAAATPVIARGCPCGEDEPTSPAKPVPPPAASPPGVLRVCADPNNLPFSNRKHEGFEDKIAELVARELGRVLEYEWLPQRLGFYRVALKNGDCNLVMAAPAGFERALTTAPYYRSTYVFVSRKSDGLRIQSFDDPTLRSVKVGVWLTGGDNTPVAHALAKRKIIDNVTGYSAFDESDGKPGEKMIAAVAAGEIDVAVAWGPSAGYFAKELSKRGAPPLGIQPVSPSEDRFGEATVPFTFDICMGLRRSDQSLRDQINEVLTRRHEAVEKILADYGVPLLPVRVAAASGGQRDHDKPEK